jgi:hypothetical protein
VLDEKGKLQSEEPLKVVGAAGDVFQWKVELLNEEMMALPMTGAIEPSWASPIEVENETEPVLLPPIELTQSIKTQAYWIQFIPTGSSKKILRKFSIETVAGNTSLFLS